RRQGAVVGDIHPQPSPRIYDPLALQLVEGPLHRVGIHPQLDAERPERWQRLPRSECARGDRLTNPLGDLEIDRDMATRVDLNVHEGPSRLSALRQYKIVSSGVQGRIERAWEPDGTEAQPCKELRVHVHSASHGPRHLCSMQGPIQGFPGYTRRSR